MREKKEEKGQPLPQFVLSPETGRAGKAAAQPKIMIREKQLFCKLIKIKKSSRQMYEEWNGQCTSSRRACPVCGCRGSWQTHGRYERSTIDYESGQVVYRHIKIRRLRCESCGRTHAVIPDYIVPYSTYSLLFILRVLGEYFMRIRTVERICSHYNITPSMLYSWKTVFEAHREMWLGVLASAEQSGLEFIRWLTGVQNYSDGFGEVFFKKTARSFLQRHRETARYRHAVF